MHIAIVNNERALPSPRATGSCPKCGGPVIAKCGDIKVHHWAHRGRTSCDHGRDQRTPWHHAWQNMFPTDWLERRHCAESGEIHIADVRTERGLIIEVQHSPLRAEEISAREGFYRNMVWVVNGARVQADLLRFLKGSRSASSPWRHAFYLVSAPERFFPQAWLKCRKPVFFDFENGWKLTEATQPLVRPLWCLLPGRMFGRAVVVCMSRSTFVRRARERSHVLPVAAIMRRIERLIPEHQKAYHLAEQLRATQAKVTLDRATDIARIHWPLMIMRRRRNPLPRF